MWWVLEKFSLVEFFFFFFLILRFNHNACITWWQCGSIDTTRQLLSSKWRKGRMWKEIRSGATITAHDRRSILFSLARLIKSSLSLQFSRNLAPKTTFCQRKHSKLLQLKYNLMNTDVYMGWMSEWECNGLWSLIFFFGHMTQNETEKILEKVQLTCTMCICLVRREHRRWGQPRPIRR